MGIRAIAKQVAYSRPFVAGLTGIGKWPSGKALLNGLSRPRGVYETFEQAWAAAGQGRHAGHDHPDSIRTHLALSNRLRPSDYPVLFWFSQLPSTELHVFDFGGNVGNLYYSYAPYLASKFTRVNWTVLDLPSVCEEGRRLAKQKNAAELSFTRSAKDACGSDVLLVSGAFHYWERSVAEFLEQFETLPRKIILNRTPVHANEPAFITVQNAGTYAVPCLVRNERELTTEFVNHGYQLMDQWKASELALHLPLFPTKSVREYSGFYFVRSDC